MSQSGKYGLGITPPLTVPDGGTGAVTLTDHGIMLGSGVGAVTVLAEASDGQLPIGSTGNDPVLANITSTTDLTITNGAGTISMDLTADTNIAAVHGWNGSLIESAAVTVTAAGGVITLSIEKAGGGNLTAVFSDGFDAWVTAPDTVTLTAGSDTSPQINYVYYLQSTKTLTASTVGWPATEFAALATVLCQSAASLQTDGAYKMHAWTDKVLNSVNQGHVSLLNKWIRQQNATWVSGVSQTLTITPNGGAADNVIFTSAAGIAYQLHEHTFPAFTGTPDVYTVNDSATAYNVVTDLNALLTDSTGASVSGRFFSLVIWGVLSEATGDCKLMVNLPGGSYNTQAGLEADSSKFANFTIPSNFKGAGFLIYQMNLKHSVAASGTWTSVSNIDLRGLIPSLAPGGSTSFATEFPDNVFRILDNADATKEIAFEASAITTATTRTITMDDRDIDMDAVPDSFATDGVAATPAAGILTVTGGNNIGTSGAGSAVTIDLNGTTQYAVQVGDATGSLDSLAVGTNGQVLLGSTGADPAFATLATSDGSITYALGAATLGLTVTQAAAAQLGGSTLATTAEVVTGTDSQKIVTSDGVAAKLGTQTDHGVLIGSGSTAAVTALTVGTDGQVLLGSSAADPIFATLASSGSTIAFTTGAGTLNLETGSAVATSAPTDSGTATPSSGVLTFTGGDNIDTSGAGSTVTIAVSSAVCDAVATDSGTATPSSGVLTIAGGANVTTSGAGSTVTVNATGGGGGLSWSEVSGTTQAMVVDQGYVANNAALVTLTLPNTAALGDVCAVAGLGAGGWKIAQNAGDTMHFISASTTTGVTGSLASTNRYDCIEIVCVVANTDFVVRSAAGNIGII